MPEILVTPDGFFALSQRFLGDAKAPSGSETALYRSDDGVSWSRASLGLDDAALVGVGMAYGAGRYVVTGWRLSQAGTVTFASDDGQTWTETLQELDYTMWSAGARWCSPVAASSPAAPGGWACPTTESAGNRCPPASSSPSARRLATTASCWSVAGGIQSSRDGLSWQSHPVDCDVPGACVTAPDGSQGAILFDVSFAAGQFRAGPLASEDGETWTVADTPVRSLPTGGYFFVVTSSPELEAQDTEGNAWPVPVVRPTPALCWLCGPPGPPPRICTMACESDGDCPSWEGTGYCAGPVKLRCEDGVCQQRSCE